MTQLQEQPGSEDSRALRPIDFGSILEDLDTCGLTPVQFRVYCHLLGGIDPSARVSKSSESIARACKLTRITVLRVLVQLEKMGMVLCDRAMGKKTVMHLQPPSLWHSAQPVENKVNSSESKVVPFPVATTVRLSAQVEACKSDIPVKEINTPTEEQVPPF